MSGLALIGSWLDAFGAEWGGELVGIAACVIGVVFGIAGVAKVRKPVLAAQSIRSFGISAGLHPRLAVALGVLEAGVALGLILESTRPVMLAVSAGLLWLYSGLIARQLHRGNHEPCFCFGETDVGTSRLTLARTGGLAAIATVALVPGTREATHVLEQLLIAVALVASAWLGSSMPALLRLNRHDHAGSARA